MFEGDQANDFAPKAIVVGAGIAGIAAALRLQASGQRVTLLEAHDWPGGKMRTVSSPAGPVDAGPTVLTMRQAFDDLFHATGAQLDDHVTLVSEPILARHFWHDGSTLDLTSNEDENAEAIRRFAGPTAKMDYLRFSAESSKLFELFKTPMMEKAEPRILELAATSLKHPRFLQTLSPLATLRKHLVRRFSDPRLVQLFGRYATYVGGSPLSAPAILSLIWHAEAAGVWRVEGGMHRLALALAERFQAIGGTLKLNTPVQEILTSEGRVSGVRTKAGQKLQAEIIVFAGDPRALATGKLGQQVGHIAPQTTRLARSLSARVWSFAAAVQSKTPLAYHNVFFGRSATSEFEDLAGGAIPSDPTIYICAEDRGALARAPTKQERFEIILNAAPLTDAAPPKDEAVLCHQTTFQTLASFGVRFEPKPKLSALATPTTYETLFPGSAGALYGQTPHGMTAALKRPRARTGIKGLYLAGGGTHPGAGVPMAALSGKHAVEAILKDLVST